MKAYKILHVPTSSYILRRVEIELDYQLSFTFEPTFLTFFNSEADEDYEYLNADTGLGFDKDEVKHLGIKVPKSPILKPALFKSKAKAIKMIRELLEDIYYEKDWEEMRDLLKSHESQFEIIEVNIK